VTDPRRLLTRLDQAADGLAADLVLYGVGAVFATVTASTSTLLPHRAWGAIAAWAYLAAFVAAGLGLAVRHTAVSAARITAVSPARITAARAWATAAAWAGSTLLPLFVQAVQRADGRTDRAQEEVVVVEQAGTRLLESGTPYLSRDAIAALPPGEQLLGYLPYQPGMAVFGLPRAVAGDVWWTDARVAFAVGTAAALGAAVLVLHERRRPAVVRAVQFATVLPICALTLATGGDDLPVLALCLLALACCATHRFGAAGLAVGGAAALKLFALPVLIVLVVAAMTHGRGRRLVAGAVVLPVVTLLPAVAAAPGAVLENVVRFPLGHGLVTSPAQSPLPGYLISANVPGGRYVAAALLVLAGAVIAVRLVRHPPRTAPAAAVFCGYGLLTAILLMPTTRFGYLLYPLALLAWVPALRATADTPAAPAPIAVPR
jgi:hypothetical protein